MKQALFLAVVIVLGLAPLANAQTAVVRPGATVAYISGQRISAETVAGREAQSRLASLRQQKTAELQDKRRALDATRQKLVGSAEGEERTQLEREEQQEQQDLERATQQAQVELQNLQRQIVVDLQPQVRSVLDDLLKGTDVQVVLQFETSIVWAAQGLDLTSAVIERLDAKTTGSEKPSAPDSKGE